MNLYTKILYELYVANRCVIKGHNLKLVEVHGLDNFCNRSGYYCGPLLFHIKLIFHRMMYSHLHKIYKII